MKEDNIERLLEAIEHPEAYSDEALERLFEDEEVKECYELYVRAQQATRNRKTVTRKETRGLLRRFCQFPVRRLSVAAIVTGAIILSGITYATIFSKRGDSREAEKAAATISERATVARPSAAILPEDTTLTFQNAELSTILETVATHYQVDVEYRNEQIRHIRLYTKWNTAEPLEQFVERLNGFEKVNITIDHNLIIAE